MWCSVGRMERGDGVWSSVGRIERGDGVWSSVGRMERGGMECGAVLVGWREGGMEALVAKKVVGWQVGN